VYPVAPSSPRALALKEATKNAQVDGTIPCDAGLLTLRSTAGERIPDDRTVAANDIDHPMYYSIPDLSVLAGVSEGSIARDYRGNAGYVMPVQRELLSSDVENMARRSVEPTGAVAAAEVVMEVGPSAEPHEEVTMEVSFDELHV
jgi:hypothetical protein